MDHPVDTKTLFQQSMQAYQSGQLGLAENLLRQVLKELPDNDAIMSTVGGVLLAAGKIDEAMALFKQAMDINPENVDAHLNMGIALQNLGRKEEGFEWMRKAVAMEPHRVDVQYNLANALLGDQKYDEAIIILEAIIKMDVSFLSAYHALGAVYGFLQKIPEAIRIYEQALVAVPGDLMTQISLANLLADTGATDRAQTVYEQAATLHANHFAAHATLGKFYLDIGKDEAGEAALQKALSLNPNDFNTNVLLGNVSRTLGRVDEAEKYYRHALKIKPNDLGATQNLRRILSSKIPYWHFEMLADVERNDAYQKVIEKVITKDSLVLDIGTGSGLLSMMAARAGAKHIVACELHQRLAATAKAITKANGYEEIIDVFADKSTQLKLGTDVPERVDVIISEILDVGALGEGALPSIRHAVQNLAKPNVKLIPAKVQLYGQVIEIPSRSLVAPIREISGFDLSLFEEYRIPNEYLKITLKAEKYRTLSEVFPIMDVDFYNLPIAYSDDQPRQAPLEISITEDGMAQAIVFWFDLYLDEEIMVSSKPNGALEHWGQALFCFPNPRAVKTEDKLRVTLLQSDTIIRFKL